MNEPGWATRNVDQLLVAGFSRFMCSGLRVSGWTLENSNKIVVLNSFVQLCSTLGIALLAIDTDHIQCDCLVSRVRASSIDSDLNTRTGFPWVKNFSHRDFLTYSPFLPLFLWSSVGFVFPFFALSSLRPPFHSTSHSNTLFLFQIPIYLSVCFCLPLCLCPSYCLYVCLSLSVSVYLPVYLCLSLCVSLSLVVCLSRSLSLWAQLRSLSCTGLDSMDIVRFLHRSPQIKSTT